MGKLHTLRRAIERNPEIWMTSYGGYYSAKGAEYRDSPPWRNWDEWEGAGWYPKRYYSNPKSYRDFVQSVLVDLGYKKEPRKSPWRRGAIYYALKPPTEEEKDKLRKDAKLALERRIQCGR